MIAYTVPLTHESLFYLASEVKVRGTLEMNDGSIVWIIQKVAKKGVGMGAIQ